MLRIKLFFLIDLLTTGIFAGYMYSERGLDAAVEIGLAIFIAFSPICLALSAPLVLKLAGRAIEAEQVKLNNLDAILNLALVDTVAIPMNRFLTDGEYSTPQVLNKMQVIQSQKLWLTVPTDAA